jgi:hypothetical protein
MSLQLKLGGALSVHALGLSRGRAIEIVVRALEREGASEVSVQEAKITFHGIINYATTSLLANVVRGEICFLPKEAGFDLRYTLFAHRKPFLILGLLLMVGLIGTYLAHLQLEFLIIFSVGMLLFGISFTFVTLVRWRRFLRAVLEQDVRDT